MEEWSLKRRIFVLAIALIEVSLCSGVMFGWPSLERIFTEYGIYSHLCNPGEPTPCDPQKLRFLLIYTIGVFMNTVGPVIIGFFSDRYGPKVTNMAGTSLFAISSLLFSVSLLYGVDIILFSFALMAFAGPAISISVFHLSNLFPGYELTIMSAFSGVFSISSLVFPMFQVMYEHGIHLGYSFGGYVLLLLPFYILGYVLYPHDSSEQQTSELVPTDSDTENLVVHSEKENRIREIKQASAKIQLKQKDFWMIIAFLSVQSLRVSMYIGTLNDRFPGPENIYTTVFPYIWPAGIIFIPLIGWMLDKKGHDLTYAILLVVCILYCIIDLLPQNRLQFITFILISFANVTNWATVFSYISFRFGFSNYGKLLGAVSITVAVFGLLQYLLVYITVHYKNGDYFAVNLFMLLLHVPLLFVPYYLYKISIF